MTVVLYFGLACSGAFVGYWLAFACWRHRHRWVIQSVHYTPPLPFGSINVTGDIMEPMRRAIEVTTDIYLKCSGCGEIACRAVYGRFDQGANPPADSELASLRKMAGLQ